MRMDQKTRVGQLIEVSGFDFVARLLGEDDGFQPEIQLGQDRIRVGQVGSYMLVEQAGYRVLTAVESMWREQGVAGETVRLVRMNPIGELGQDGEFLHPVEQPT